MRYHHSYAEQIAAADRSALKHQAGRIPPATLELVLRGVDVLLGR